MVNKQKPKEKIIIIPAKSANVFRIGKKFFMLKEQKIGKDNHIKRLIFEETSEKEYESNLDYLADSILKNNQVDQKTILVHALMSLSKKELSSIKKGINKLKKPKYKRGCLSLDIDGIEVPIFGRASFLDGGNGK